MLTEVKRLMYGIIGQFILDMLIGQHDAHPLNWEVKESINGINVPILLEDHL